MSAHLPQGSVMYGPHFASDDQTGTLCCSVWQYSRHMHARAASQTAEKLVRNIMAVYEITEEHSRMYASTGLVVRCSAEAMSDYHQDGYSSNA